MNIACIRTDRIGDLILTMPAMKAVADAGHEVSVVVSPRTRTLLDGQPFLKEIFDWDHASSVSSLIDWLRARRFDAAVCFYPRLNIALALRRAGVPVRIGTAYRWYSWLFNRRVAIHRSAQDRHETEFNMELLSPLGIPPIPVRLVAPVAGNPPSGLPLRYAVVHPAGGGSALNASPDHWGRIAAAIEHAGSPVIVTGSASDRPVLESVARIGGLGIERIVIPGSLGELGGVLSGAVVVVGPSTGPVHMAAALGRPVVALYSPLKSQQSARWRPLSDASTVLTPHEAVCPTCLGEACPLWNCMDRIAPDRVAAAVLAVAS